MGNKEILVILGSIGKNAKGPVNRGVAVVLRAGGAFKRKVAHIGGFRITKNKARVDKFGKNGANGKFWKIPAKTSGDGRLIYQLLPIGPGGL